MTIAYLYPAPLGITPFEFFAHISHSIGTDTHTQIVADKKRTNKLTVFFAKRSFTLKCTASGHLCATENLPFNFKKICMSIFLLRIDWSLFTWCVQIFERGVFVAQRATRKMSWMEERRKLPWHKIMTLQKSMGISRNIAVLEMYCSSKHYQDAANVIRGPRKLGGKLICIAEKQI